LIASILSSTARAKRRPFAADVVVIEDKASGTQLIQELVAEDVHAVTRYQPQTDKDIRMHAQTARPPVLERADFRPPCGCSPDPSLDRNPEFRHDLQ
jgi:hypothetical protein